MRHGRPKRILAAGVGVGLLLSMPVSGSAGSRAGIWRGATSQGKNVHFKIGDDQRIHSFTITVTVTGATCDIDVALVAKGLDTQVKDSDSFRLTAHQDSSTVVVNGTFASLRGVTGTARVVENGGQCGDGTGHADWKASR